MAEMPLTQQELYWKNKELDDAIAQSTLLTRIVVYLIAPSHLRKYLDPPKPKPCMELVYGLP